MTLREHSENTREHSEKANAQRMLREHPENTWRITREHSQITLREDSPHFNRAYLHPLDAIFPLNIIQDLETVEYVQTNTLHVYEMIPNSIFSVHKKSFITYML